MKRSIVPALALALSTLAVGAHAQDSASAPAPAPVSAEKKALVAKLVEIQRPGYDEMSRGIALGPAQAMRQQLSMVLQRAPEDKREALAKDLEGDLRKYVEEAQPIAKDTAAKFAAPTAGALFEQRFSEDELKQVIAMLESPIFKKFTATMPEVSRGLEEKLRTEMAPTVEPKLRALQQSVTQRLQAAAAAASAPAAKAPAKAPAPKK